MLQDPHPNTYGHCFSVGDDLNIETALNVAIGSYTARWGIQPVNLFVHPAMIPIPNKQVAVIAHSRIPKGVLWFEVPRELVKGGNGR
jgi:hypothetical protein